MYEGYGIFLSTIASKKLLNNIKASGAKMRGVLAREKTGG